MAIVIMMIHPPIITPPACSKEVLNLNDVPLAGYFPTKNQLDEKSTYPLKLLFCDNCKLTQTDSVINPDVLFKDYRYLSSI